MNLNIEENIEEYEYKKMRSDNINITGFEMGIWSPELQFETRDNGVHTTIKGEELTELLGEFFRVLVKNFKSAPYTKEEAKTLLKKSITRSFLNTCGRPSESNGNHLKMNLFYSGICYLLEQETPFDAR